MMETAAAVPATRRMRLALLLAYALLVAVRMPNIWAKGRFWAEEGAVYFRNARLEAWYDALFAVHTGYLNLAASIATLLAARLVPLEWAPWVSTGFALLIQLCPPLLLMTGGIGWLRDTRSLALALLLLLIPHGSAEVWLNSITSQFHLGLCVVLILALPVRGGWVGGFRLGLLVLAPLSGPASTFLTPLFLVRAIAERSWARAGQGVLLGAMAFLQLLMVLTHPEPARDIGIGPRLLALVIYEKHILLPVIGFDHTFRLVGDFVGAVRGGGKFWGEMLLAALASALMVTGVAWHGDRFVRWLFAGAVVIMLMSYFGALGHHVDLLGVSFGDRYSYVPSALFGITLLGLSRLSGRWTQKLALILVAWIVCIGMNDFMWVGRGFADGSRWAKEAANWRADHQYQVEFWPNGWRWPIGENP